MALADAGVSLEFFFRLLAERGQILIECCVSMAPHNIQGLVPEIKESDQPVMTQTGELA